jgi:Type II intron maturase
LRETLALELNASKTLITHARTRAARFPGCQIITQHSSTRVTRGRRTVNGNVALRVPRDVITAKCAPYRHQGKPWHRPRLQNLGDYDIVRIYAAEYRGIVNYYLLACNVSRLATLRCNAETSMLKTRAAKHKSTVATMAARHKAKVITGDGPRTCFEARLQRKGKKDLIARFGGIVLKRDKRAVITDPAPVPVHPPRKELIDRLRKRRCELCDHGATVIVHHVAKLTQLGKAGPGQPAWAALMARKRRKTLIVCRPCHDYIHANPVANAAQSLESPVH